MLNNRCPHYRFTPRIISIAALAASGIISICLPGYAVGASAKAQTRVLSVGVLAPASGNTAASGKDMKDGWNYWFANNGTTFGATTIRTSFYDTASSPNTSLTKARQAVEKDHVDILVGTLLSSSALAIVPYAAKHKIPYLIPETGADDLAQRSRSKYAIKAGGWNSSQPAHVAGAWAYEHGYRKAVTIVSGYAFGYENSGGFSQVFHDAGGKITEHLFPPLGTKDFSPYLSRIRNAKPDVVFATLVGADGQSFLKQWTSFGLSKEIPLINTQTTTDQSNMREGDPAIFDGLISVGYYAPGRDDPVTQDFVKGYAAKYGSIPDSHAASMYLTAQWLSKAVESLPADATPDQLIDAINRVTFANTPFGPYKLDEYGGPVFNVYLMKVVPTPDSLKKYGAVWNVVERKWDNVSQFWTYDPKTYLKQPVYSESFQGY
jgi:branched-chain amino acid transport system substrate-binding protein